MKIKTILTVIILVCSWQISVGQKTNKKVTISGIVLDSKKQPIEGAVIFIDEVNTCLVTNNQGYYKVKTGPKAQKLSVFSFSNGASEEVINGRISINFILTGKTLQPTSTNKTDDNETVNDGYSTVKKKDLTTSVSKIDGQKLRF